MQAERAQDNQAKVIQSTQPDKLTPKYCTSIQVGLLNSGNLVLSLLYSEPSQPALLIERVIIDIEHADNLANVLKAAVSEAQAKISARLN
jgi:hypothetical protein